MDIKNTSDEMLEKQIEIESNYSGKILHRNINSPQSSALRG
jgi:hypothetical protein